MPKQANGLYEFGGCQLDAAMRRLLRAGENLTLAPKTFDLLLLLVQSEGRVLNKRELMNSLWPDTFVEEASLSYQIATLRKVLGEEGDLWIETVPKHGYRFATPVMKIADDHTRADDQDQRGTDASPSPEPSAKLPTRALVPWLVATTTNAVALLAIILYFRAARPSPEVMQFSILIPEKTSLRSASGSGRPVISPDGLRLAFVAFGADGRQLIWIRPLDSRIPQPLAGTEGAVFPFWAPDSRNLGFFASDKLKRINIAGGPSQTLADASSPRGGTWNREGVIVFSGPPTSLLRISATGGPATPVLPLDSTIGVEIRWPWFLPDGRHLLYYRRASINDSGTYLTSLDSSESRLLMRGFSSVAYAAGAGGQGYLLFASGGVLTAQNFDPVRGQVLKDRFPVAGEVGVDLLDGAEFSISENGVLAYLSEVPVGRSQLTWFDRMGRKFAAVGITGEHERLALSPDETTVAFSQRDPQTGNPDIWLLDLARTALTRFTFDGTAMFPVWSPDGRRIAFSSNRDGPMMSLVAKSSSGAGSEELLLKTTESKLAYSWSPDGRYLAYSVFSPRTGHDIAVLPIEGSGSGTRNPFLVVQTQFNERNAQFSPDGRWLAYASDESGQAEVYVRNFTPPDVGAATRGPAIKRQVSTRGGTTPRWRRDGKELFYAASDGKLMAVDVQADAQSFKPGLPHALFDAQLDARLGTAAFYAVTKDGQRFLVPVPIGESPPIHLIVNWKTAVKR
jgi:Tol biopolymer transport system component/DNA-binding winged helix-turn-helix (wHTH) protein